MCRRALVEERFRELGVYIAGQRLEQLQGLPRLLLLHEPPPGSSPPSRNTFQKGS